MKKFLHYILAKFYQRKLNKILGLILFIAIYLLLLFYLESAEKKNPDATIKNMGDAFWYTIVTLATVGYGDKYPITVTGKFIGGFFIIGALGVVGYFIHSISFLIKEFVRKWTMGAIMTSFENHFIIYGWNDFGKNIAKQLLDARKRVIIITRDEISVNQIRDIFSYNLKNLETIVGDNNNDENFINAAFEKAHSVFINLNDDTEKLVAVVKIKEIINKQKEETNNLAMRSPHFVVMLENADLKNTFESMGITFIISKNEVASKLAASYIFEPHVASISSELMTVANKKEGFNIDLQEYLITDQFLKNLQGNTIGLIPREIRNKLNIIAIFTKRDILPQNKNIQLENVNKNEIGSYIKLPLDTETMVEGDYIIAVIAGNSEQEILSFFMIKEQGAL
jgi:voltage-gated potassium channel